MAAEQPTVENPVAAPAAEHAGGQPPAGRKNEPTAPPPAAAPEAAPEEIVVPDHKSEPGGIIDDDPWGLGASADGGKVRLVVSTKTAAIALGVLVLVLAVYPLVAGGDDDGASGGATAPAPAPGGRADLSCDLLPGGGAPPGKWNVEYFGTTHLDVPVATVCEVPTRPAVVDNGATAAVLAFYSAVDLKDVPGITRATVPGYTATIHGCASIGGVQGCPCDPSAGRCAAEEWADGQEFTVHQFESLVNAYPARTGGTYRRELTVDAGKDGRSVVLNQYSLPDGSMGTAVHTVAGCPSSCRVVASEWINGALDAADVAGETSSGTYISQFWNGGDSPGPLNGQTTNFALRYSGDFVFEDDIYQFWASSDDGSRLYVDDKLVLDRWGACCDMWHADPIALTAGSHSVMMEYTQGGGGAFLELGWQKFIGCPVSSPLLATYYPGDEIDEASEILGGCTSTVRNDWGMFGPVELGLDMQVGAFDHFSVRWDGELSFISDDSYVFSTFADDGSRLWVADTNAPSMGAPIIDRWESCCVAFSSAPIGISRRDPTSGALVPATKHVRYEMHEIGGSAYAFLSWAATSDYQNAWLDSSYVETVAITGGSDDIEVMVSDGSVDVGSSDLELTDDGGTQAIAMLFRGVQIEHGATVLSAKIQFHADEAQSEPTNLVFQGLICSDQSPCVPFLPATPPVQVPGMTCAGSTCTGLPTAFGGRPITRAAVPWSSVPEWTVESHQTSTQSDLEQRSPDIRDVVQEVVNSPGWVSGKDLAIVITGTGHRTADSFDGHPDKATTLTLAVREGGATMGVPDIYGVSDDYAHPNLLINGELDSPVGVDCDACEGTPGAERTNCVKGWNTNNAALAIVEKAGRVGVLEIGDSGSFSEINQAISTVPGTHYTLSYDVYIEPGQLHSLNDFCVTADSNGQLIVRDEATSCRAQADGHAGGGHCGGNAAGEVNNHCHGVMRLCPQTEGHWVTISGTHIATNDVTTFALHSESRHSAYYDRVSVTTALDTCVPAPADDLTPAFQAEHPVTEAQCQCAWVDEL